MNSNKKIACPLDCYDTCEASLVDENIKGSKEHPITDGKLCVNFANLLKQEPLKSAFFAKKDIGLDESLEILIDIKGLSSGC